MRRLAGAVLAGCLAIAVCAVAACGDDPGAVEPSLVDASEAGTSPDASAAPDAPDASDASDARDARSEDAAAEADASANPFCLRGSADGGVGALGECLAHLAIAPSLKELPYYRSHDLETTNAAIQNLVVIQHGNSRNAWSYYDDVSGPAFARDPLHTAVIAPLFQILSDPKAPGDLYWFTADWKEGKAARNEAQVDSFAALDALIKKAKAAFPNLKRVTVAGYSAGAQTIQRYAAGNTEHDRTAPAIATRYVVASPGSYMYLDGQRVKTDVACPSAADCAVDATSFEVPAYAPLGCESAEPLTTPDGPYDDYKYGLANRTVGYYAAPLFTDEYLRGKYLERNVVYVSSDGDSSNGAGPGPPVAYTALDKDCPAQVQGPAGNSFRLQRALVFHRYVTLVWLASHRMQIVAGCGHEDSCVLRAPLTQVELFDP